MILYNKIKYMFHVGLNSLSVSCCVVGYSYMGDISIDDVTFVDCAPPVPSVESGVGCLPGQYQCDNRYCINSSSVCDMQQDCLDASDETV